MGDHGGQPTPPRPPRRRWWPWLAVLVGALALGLGVAACGGGDKPSGVASLGGATQTTSASNAGGSQDEGQAARNFARCMRQHGINVPDPQITGDDIVQQLPTRAEQNSPKFQAAEQACQQSRPNSGHLTRPSAQELGQLRAFAVCMRAHDIDMSDPDPKTGNMTTTGYVTRDQVQNDPAFKAAEAACRDKLPTRELQQKR